MSMNTEVIPGSPLYKQKYSEKDAQYKTDLKLISAMCLQGLLANPIRNGYTEKEESALAIRCAKELLTQLKTIQNGETK